MLTQSRSVPTRAESSDDDQIFLNLRGRYDELTESHIRIHLGPHSHLSGQVDARLDRKTDARDKESLLARLEIVDVRPRSVQVLGIDRVARPMDEIIAKPASSDHGARRVVHLSAAHRLAAADPRAQQLEGRVPCVAYRSPHLYIALARLAQREHPRLVGVDAISLPRPEIDQQNVASADC